MDLAQRVSIHSSYLDKCVIGLGVAFRLSIDLAAYSCFAAYAERRTT